VLESEIARRDVLAGAAGTLAALATGGCASMAGSDGAVARFPYVGLGPTGRVVPTGSPVSVVFR